MKLINIGFGNMVSANRLVAIVSPESAPIRRIISKAKESNMSLYSSPAATTAEPRSHRY